MMKKKPIKMNDVKHKVPKQTKNNRGRKRLRTKKNQDKDEIVATISKNGTDKKDASPKSEEPHEIENEKSTNSTGNNIIHETVSLLDSDEDQEDSERVIPAKSISTAGIQSNGAMSGEISKQTTSCTSDMGNSHKKWNDAIKVVHPVTENSSTQSVDKNAHRYLNTTELLPLYNHGINNLTVTPVPRQNAIMPPAVSQPPPVPIPDLTDDMFVLEAPSLVASYIYEKPPSMSLKKYVDNLKSELVAKDPDVDLNMEDDSMSSANYLELMGVKNNSQYSKAPTAPEELATTKLIDYRKTRSVNPQEFFTKPLGIFFMSIGLNLVQEFVQKDLLDHHKKKLTKEIKNGSCNLRQTESIITSLTKSVESTTKKNAPFKCAMKKCSLCSFQSESTLAIAYHFEEPHMRNNLYKCNFCPVEVKSSQDIVNHVIFQHSARCRVEKARSNFQCPNCLYEDRFKAKLVRHITSCEKRFRQETNLMPPFDWEPPAKLNTPGFFSTFDRMHLEKSLHPTKTITNIVANIPKINNLCITPSTGQSSTLSKSETNSANEWLVLPGGLRLQGVEATIVNPNATKNNVTNKPIQFHPSISITPLPCSTSISLKPAQSVQHHGVSDNKSTFVICEVCDGFIKDLEQLRNHMMWIHKLKIHPKMIYNKPPLNCQKCHFRFFTDQGLERHLLGSHGLVTDSMQLAASKGIDSGRCPTCGKVYQMKLLSHVARDHNMVLRPAHLSYKCTVCSETFGMYKHFEKHVYIEHSIVARRVTERTSKEPVNVDL